MLKQFLIDVRVRLAAVFARHVLHERADEEVQFHLSMIEQRMIESGMTPEVAHAQARREFGNPTLVKERTLDAWPYAVLDTLIQDVRYAWRIFRRTPGFSATAIVTLALGIGANTVVFSVLDAVLLRPLPYREPGQLVSVLDREIRAGGRATFFDLYSDYENWNKNSHLFEGFAAMSWASGLGRIMKGHGPARSVAALPVSVDFFSVLGVPALLGRTFQSADLAGGCSVVLSHKFWQAIFGGQRNAINQSLQLDNQACAVLGVMPPEFASYPNPDSLLWVLLAPPKRPDQFGVFVIGRMKPGISLAAAEAEILALHHQIHQHDRWGGIMEPAIYGLQSEFTWLTGRNLRISLIALFAAVSAVLSICCVNVANLLLSRSLVRQREMAIRAALGSGRGRVLRQLMTESLSLSLIAAVFGVALAAGAVEYFRSANPIELPPATIVSVNAHVLGFMVVLSIATAVLFGLAPAWNASRIDLVGALKAGGRSLSQDAAHHRFGKALIVAEVALTIVLLVGAGLLIRSVQNFTSAPLGFTPEGLLITRFQLPPNSYAKPERRAQFYRNALAELRAQARFEGAALSTALPTQGTGPVSSLAVEGRPDPPSNHMLDIGQQTVSPDYFRVMRIPLKTGRYFDERDHERAEPVAIVNEVLVERYFPNENPIGKHIREYGGAASQQPWLRVVGVVADEKRTAVSNEMSWADVPVIYHAWDQNSPLAATLIVRIPSGQDTPGGTIQRTLAAIDSDVSVGEIEPVPASVAKILAYPRFRAITLAAFAGLAVLLALVGLHGVLSHLVTHRTHEIGVRMALGAQRSEVLGMIVAGGMRLIGLGVVVGLFAVLALGHFLRTLLYGISAADPLLLASVSLGMIVVALGAISFPARRAASVDPLIALRYE
jgi:putative ABC transport system permease protein